MYNFELINLEVIFTKKLQTINNFTQWIDYLIRQVLISIMGYHNRVSLSMMKNDKSVTSINTPYMQL